MPCIRASEYLVVYLLYHFINYIDYSTNGSILIVTMKQQTYVDQVVETWESEYKKGLLTFWILLSLHDSDRHAREIKQFIEHEAVTNLEVDEKSVYRSIGRLRKMGLINHQSVDSPNGGPMLKLNYLTSDGKAALRQFYTRNIKQIFLTQEFTQRTKGL